MIQYYMMRANRPCTIIELSLADLFRLLLGRELGILNKIQADEQIVMRHKLSFELFNLKAPKQ